MENIQRKLCASDIYSAKDGFGKTYISSGMSFEGEGSNFIFTLEEDKYMRISTDVSFECYFEYISYIKREEYWSYVLKINERFGTAWDEEHCCIYIRFRRNEMKICEALSRIRAAVTLLASLGSDLLV